MYAKFFKRLLDVLLSFTALLVLSPVFLILSAVGAFALKGNPFFMQCRPGKIGSDGKEKIFKMLKFRTMSNEKDENGNLLSDEKRLTNYGKVLRRTSLDELPELVNILKGDMSVIGPRPLLVKYLPLYSREQRRRHSVRPGITGLAQVNGRNAISWEKRFEYDIQYVENITFIGDCKILLQTVGKVLKRDGITSDTSVTMEEFTGGEAKTNE